MPPSTSLYPAARDSCLIFCTRLSPVCVAGPSFVHHHSYAYINAPTRLSRCFFSLVRGATHIVLSAGMGSQLTRLYDVPAGALRVVSNAAFYESPEPFDASSEADSKARAEVARPLRIGFLSNISHEKGFVEYFGVLARLRQHTTVRCRGVIAGPLAADAEPEFTALLRQAADVEYLGPLYGSAKERFYENLDIFLFPTRYANEAEPLVVYEALQHGVFVIACRRGSIPEMLSNGAGMVFANDEVVAGAVGCIQRWDADRPALKDASAMALLQAQRIRAAGRRELDALLSTMQGDALRFDGADAA